MQRTARCTVIPGKLHGIYRVGSNDRAGGGDGEREVADHNPVCDAISGDF